MVQTSELDPKSILVEGWADYAKCSMEHRRIFVILRQKHVIFRHKASQPVYRCIFYYRLSQQILSTPQHNSREALFSRRVES
jgi:hypothetical protein